jgi:predicted transcriptional regulator
MPKMGILHTQSNPSLPFSTDWSAPMPLNPELDEQRMRHLSFLVNDFIIWHLSRVRHGFDGDLDCALILGEIAHYNVRKNFQKIFSLDQEPISGQEQAVNDSSSERVLLKRTNTLSISAATGIPWETVRRKIQWLEQRGWISKDDKGKLIVTVAPEEEFSQFNYETLERFVATADKLRKIMEQASPGGKDLI